VINAVRVNASAPSVVIMS